MDIRRDVHPTYRIDVLLVTGSDVEGERFHQGTDVSQSKRAQRRHRDKVRSSKRGRGRGVTDDLTWPGDSGQSGCGIDRRPEDVSAVLHHCPSTDARAQQRKSVDATGLVVKSPKEGQRRSGVRTGDHHGVAEGLDHVVAGSEVAGRYGGEPICQLGSTMITVSFGESREPSDVHKDDHCVYVGMLESAC
ncbi:hypothetical protein [Mycolicibacterium sp. OfavD-34-C]|uniref:hypothetical protein n=1 Tax=Mycolicibacterium hippocampi TaxID=659824 RepID=UPI001EF51D0D|nr:hypothetical protein [Mycolicibacterium sp. OfavD-34-C]MCG7583442.1 hypothetical protein [Mycolicibacterium sp. OfavD-34-C]